MLYRELRDELYRLYYEIVKNRRYDAEVDYADPIIMAFRQLDSRLVQHIYEQTKRICDAAVARTRTHEQIKKGEDDS